MSIFTEAKDTVEMLCVVCTDLAGERRVYDHISICISCWV